MIYEHVILGKYHMTYQGIGHQCDHKSLHNHLIERALDVRLVH